MVLRFAILTLTTLAIAGERVEAEQRSAFYTAFTDSEPSPFWEFDRSPVRHYRYWRAHDGRTRVELGLITSLGPGDSGASAGDRPYYCVRPIVIGLPSHWIIINRLNNLGIRLSRSAEIANVLPELETASTCFGLCPLGDEVEWFSKHRTAIGDTAQPLRFELPETTVTLHFDVTSRIPQVVEHEHHGLTRRTYTVYQHAAEIDDAVFSIAQDVQWQYLANAEDRVSLLAAISASPRPEYFEDDVRKLEFGDFDFDGESDFAIARAGNGRCGMMSYFIYEPGSDTYRYIPDLSNLCNARFNAERRRIVTFQPGGWSSRLYYSEVYVWEGRRISRISAESQVPSERVDGWVTRRWFTDVNGELQLVEEVDLDPWTESF